jgi:hypothetical protein
MAVFQNNLLAGAGAQSSDSTYTIDQSIRFNQDDSAYMYKNFSGAGNKKTATWSFWCKRADLGDRQDVISFAQDVPFIFQANDTLYVATFGASSLITNRVFRDPSAWYHFVLTVDSTNTNSSDRIRLYVNGQRETSFSTENYPSLNADANFWTGTPSSPYTAYAQQIGNIMQGTYYNGLYLAEIHFLDGISYGPEYFGETNSNGIWVPKEYDGSYGTNGFYIDGRDSSDLGDDESGNGNDFTTTGLAAHDQIIDTPTNNFSVMNPLDNYYYGTTFSNGNLEVTTPNSSSTYTFNTSTILVSSGKWYVEFFVTYLDSNLIGVAGQASGAATHILGTKNDQVGYYAPDGNYYKNNSAVSYGNSYAQNDIIGVALDLDNNKLYFSKNGTFQNSGVPTSGSTGTGAISIPASSATVDGGYRFACGDFSNNNNAHNINFGQDGTFAGRTTAGGNSDGNGIGNFKYSVPSGYLALCTKNLGS